MQTPQHNKMSSKKNDLVLQQLLAENQRLKQELESSKNAIKVSEACKTLIDYITKTAEPFDKNKFTGYVVVCCFLQNFSVNEFAKTKGGCFG